MNIDPPDRFAIHTSGLTRRFGDVIAVDHIALRVPYGEIFGLLGANGAGKSTVIKMLTTLLSPSSGMAEVGGFNIISSPADVRRRIGYVSQLLSADGALTGYENLRLSAKLYDLPKSEREERIRSALEFMGLVDSANKLVRTYSGGMIRRLELAQAMLHRPAILFLDEPTIGLDPVARHTVWERLRDLRRDFGMTVLITTHDMEEAESLCDRLAIMHKGQISVVGTPAELRAELGDGANMDDVFVHYAGGSIQESGTFREIVQNRRAAHRLG
ncbi:daunorubicin/doxorubicin resistance ATP-binding protein DrrA [Sideroxyarcus emersonii]|uniref:Daunorubicin/doxorubicin resistance ATP-binding protein DrrA n=1 Tax=Sideroxyarcus emersonii TaxID=2764705 RepID=A0AAN1X8T9_9PROT|nr:ATP-binding cassette domain-containing protein [Sideroxyarcus emersonii]BCK86702.1 daunorubicin/doxorubicin resistance ATP-binding protein DrrA [Sideroxyarcus emersonii]